jgi:hypothetical protein
MNKKCSKNIYNTGATLETFSVTINVRIKIAQFPLQVFIFIDVTLTSIYNFQVKRPRCVAYTLKM